MDVNVYEAALRERHRRHGRIATVVLGVAMALVMLGLWCWGDPKTVWKWNFFLWWLMG